MTTGLLEPIDFDPFAAGLVADVCATTEAQREIWAADRLGVESSLAYNEALRLTLRGPLDVERLRQALDAVVARHDALRSTIGPDGLDMLVSEPVPGDWQVHRLADLSPDVCRQRMADACAAAVTSPFDLERGPLFRRALYVLGDRVSVLLLSAHHIVCDGWSWGVVLDDLAAAYAGSDAASRTAAPGFRGYSEWKAALATRPEWADDVAYWRRCYGTGTLPVLELPIDHRRPPVRQFGSRRVDHRLQAPLVQALRALAARSHASLFSTLLAGYAALLSRLTGQDDIVVGVSAAGQLAGDMPKLVGHCVDLLPMRLSADAAGSFEHHLRATSGVVLDVFEHQSLTYGALLKLLSVPRDPSRVPLVSACFNLDSALPAGAALFPGLEVEIDAVARQADSFELSLNVVPAADGSLELQLQYSTALFERSTVVRWLDSLEAVYASAVRDPAAPLAKLDCLTAPQIAALAALQPARAALGAPLGMHQLVQAQSRRTPDHVALRAGDDTLTYGALEARSNQLARLLRERGVARGRCVGVCMARGVDMMVALFAVLKAGAAYVPMDPSVPQQRLDDQALDANVALMLSTPASRGGLPLSWCAPIGPRVLALDLDALLAGVSPAPLTPSSDDSQPDDVAYVIYTSGSTGKPKGVQIAHRAAVNFLRSAAVEPGMSNADTVVAVTTLSFDIALIELVLPLTVGATVVIASRDTVMDSGQLAELIERSGATVLSATPSLWRVLMDADWQGRPGFRAIAGAESLPTDLAAFLQTRSGEVWNMYGPTETTVYSTVWAVDAAVVAADGMSIGHPIANTDIWVLDADLQLCPLGVFGEICIGGEGVAVGYLHRPELDRERFVVFESPLGPTRVYRTGDRGRWTSSGLLQHGGRFDAQIKVRGYRIEPGEIEACCDAQPHVTGSVAVAWQAGTGDSRLVLYVAVPPDAPADGFSVPLLLQALRQRLPEYMLPQHVVRIERIPRLPNGKIDRMSLPAPDPRADTAATRPRVAPRTDTEQAVLACMEQVLALPGLGVHDDFFALGGHSLLAARLVTQLNRVFALQLRLPVVFECPTVERLASAVDAMQRQGAQRREPIAVQPGRRSARLSPMQERVRFVQEMHPDRVLYNAPSAHRLRGPLDSAVFERTFREIIRRQPSMRTSMAFDAAADAHVQVVADDLPEPLSFVDLSGVDGAEREAVLMERMQSVVDTPMDIHRAPLFRAVLYHLSVDEHVFFYMPHHLIWDGWSYDLLQDEFAAIYAAYAAGEPHTLPPLALSYGDYAEWYLRWMRSPECAAQLAYWTARFAAAPPMVAARTDRPRRAGMSGDGGIEWVAVQPDLQQAWRQLARRHDITVNMLGFAMYATMLASVIGTPSLVIAVPVRGRLAEELEPVMGFFNNLLAVHVHVDAAQPLSAFLRSVKATLLDVMHRQDVPFEMVVEVPAVANRAQGVGHYHGLFSFQDVSNRPRRWGELAYSSIPLLQKGATDDLGLWLLDAGDALRGGFIYNADIYDASTAVALRERFLELVAAAAAGDDLPLGQLIASDRSSSAAALRHLAHDFIDSTSQATAAAQPFALSAVASKPDQARPWTEDELALGGIWATLLGTDLSQLRPTDNFFDLGGDSLLAMRAVNQSASAFSFRVDARRYVYETLAQLASRTAAANEPPAEPRLRSLRRVFSAWRRSAG